MRVAKIAAVQAKANAQTAKLRAEKLAKGAVVSAGQGGNKYVLGENGKSGVGGENSGKQGAGDGGGGGRGGRGGRGGGKVAAGGKDAHRAKAQQQQRQQQAKAQDGPAVTLIDEASSTNGSPVVSLPPQNEPSTSTSTPTPAARNGDGQAIRGGRGRGREQDHEECTGQVQEVVEEDVEVEVEAMKVSLRQVSQKVEKSHWLKE